MVEWLQFHPVTVRGAGSSPVRTAKFRDVVQLIERSVWDREAAGLSPVIPTEIKIKRNENNCTIPATTTN